MRFEAESWTKIYEFAGVGFIPWLHGDKQQLADQYFRKNQTQDIRWLIIGNKCCDLTTADIKKPAT